MMLVILLATLLLLLAIVLFGGTILATVKVAASQSSRVAYIRQLREAGLAVNQEGEEG